MKRAQNDERGFESALGVDYEKLTEDWHDFVKREYWPDLVNRENFDDFSTKITDRTETEIFIMLALHFRQMVILLHISLIRMDIWI